MNEGSSTLALWFYAYLPSYSPPTYKTEKTNIDIHDKFNKNVHKITFLKHQKPEFDSKYSSKIDI